MAMEMTRDLAVRLKGEYRDEISPGIARTQQIVVQSMRQIAAAVSVAAIVYGLERMVKAAADFGDEMNKAAQKYGIAAEQLSVLKYAADLSGVSFGEMGVAFKTMATHMMAAAEGSKEAQALFRQLGVSAVDSAGRLKAPNDMLAELADRFAAMPDGAQKTALAVGLFGRSGAQMIPLLNQGSAGIRKMQEEATAFGLVISGRFAQQAEDFNDNLDRMGKIAEGVAVSIAQALIPALDDAMENFITLWKQVGPEFLENIRLGFLGIANSIRLVAGSAEEGGGSIRLMGQLLAMIPLGLAAAFNTVYMTIAGALEGIAGYISSVIGPLATYNTGLGFLIQSLDKRRKQAAESLLELRMQFDRIWETKSGTAQAMLDSQAGKVSGGGTIGIDPEKAKAEQEKLHQLLVQAQKGALDEIQKLWLDHAEKIREIDQMETVSHRQKEEAKAQVTAYYLDQAKQKHQENADEIALSWAKTAEKNMAREREQADRFGEFMMQKVREINEAREQAAQHVQAMLSIDTEGRVQRIQFDTAITDEERRILIEEARLLGEQASLQASIQYKVSIGDVAGADEDQARLDLITAQLRELADQMQRTTLQGMLMERMLKFSSLSKAFKGLQSIGVQAFLDLEAGFKQSIAAALLGQQSFGEALRQMTAQILASIAAEAVVQAIYATALGFLRLAQWDFKAAGEAFTSAAYFAAVAAAAGAGAMALSGGGNQGGGSGGEGESGNQYAPREYTRQDLDRMRNGGQAGGGEGGGSESEAAKTVFHITMPTTIMVNDMKDAERVEKKLAQRRAKAMASELVHNADLAKRFGRIQQRKY